MKASKLPAMSEKEFQAQVIQLARLHGWIVAHFRPAQTRKGKWVTPVAADGKGYPDLVLVRDRVIFAELKTDTGKLTPEQEQWHERLKAAGAQAEVWRPMFFQLIEAALTARGWTK